MASEVWEDFPNNSKANKINNNNKHKTKANSKQIHNNNLVVNKQDNKRDKLDRPDNNKVSKVSNQISNK